jgi:hypothetical protein
MGPALDGGTRRREKSSRKAGKVTRRDETQTETGTLGMQGRSTVASVCRLRYNVRLSFVFFHVLAIPPGMHRDCAFLFIHTHTRAVGEQQKKRTPAMNDSRHSRQQRAMRVLTLLQSMGTRECIELIFYHLQLAFCHIATCKMPIKAIPHRTPQWYF